MVVLASFTQPIDGIRHRQNNTTVYVNDNNLGKGTLYIAESRLSWVTDSGNGFSIEYPHISLHAVSRDLSSFPQECLFLMLDTALEDENEKNGDAEDDDENQNDSDEQETTELRLVPDDRGMLDAMFHAMNACQALHPDPEDSFSDEDFYEDADDEVPVEETGSQMANLSIGNMDSGASILGRKLLNGREVGMEEESTLGRGTLEVGVDMGAGMGVDMGAGMVADMEEESTLGRSTLEVGVDMGVDMGVDTGVDTEAERAEDILGSMEEEEEEEEACMGVGMVQSGRSFSSGNTWHQGRLVGIPPELRHQTEPEEESNFADAEN